MNRYETFVVRLWMEDDSAVRHGEVRHVTTGKELRFLQMEQAFDFIESIATRQHQSAEAPDNSDVSPDHRQIDFDPRQSRG